MVLLSNTLSICNIAECNCLLDAIAKFRRSQWEHTTLSLAGMDEIWGVIIALHVLSKTISIRNTAECNCLLFYSTPLPSQWEENTLSLTVLEEIWGEGENGPSHSESNPINS